MEIETGKSRARLAGLAMTLSLALAGRAGAASEQGIARSFSLAAVKAGTTRVAVLPFRPSDGSQSREGRMLADRLAVRLAQQDSLTVVERSSLEDIMKEHYRGQVGAFDEKKLAGLGRLLQAQAVVVGSFVGVGRKVELQLRLVALESGAILAAAELRLRREPSWELPGLFSATTPITAGDAAAEALAYQRGESLFAWSRAESPKPALQRASQGLRDPASGARSCRDYARRADELQRGVLELKARYWAAQTRRRTVSAKTLRVQPDSMISNPALRERFLELMRRHAAAPGPSLSEAEVRRFVAADGEAFGLLASCGHADPS